LFLWAKSFQALILKTSFAILVLLLYPSFSHPISEYTYLFEPPDPSILKTYFAAPDCRPALSLNIDGLAINKAARFQESLSRYESAKWHLQKAQFYARMEYPALFASYPVYKLSVALCYRHLFESIRYASQSAQEGLRSLELPIVEFNRMQDEAHDFTRGVRNELDAFHIQMQQGQRNGIAIAPRILRAADALSELRSFPDTSNDFRALTLLVSKDSVLSESFELGTRLDDAMREMVFRDRHLAEQVALRVLQINRREDDARANGLYSIQEDKLTLRFTSFMDSRELVPSFSLRISQMRRMVEEANLLSDQARSIYEKNNEGYLSRAIIKRQDALRLLDSVLLDFDVLETDARYLQHELEQEVRLQYSDVADRIESRRHQPLVYSLLLSLQDEYLSVEDAYYSLSNVGTKINHLFIQLEKLAFIKEMSGATDAYVYLYSDTRAQWTALESIRNAAVEDRVPLSEETERLRAISSSLNALAEPNQPNAQALQHLREEMSVLKQTLFEKVRNAYPFIERDYSFLSRYRNELPPALQERLLELDVHFSNGLLDWEQQVGSLHSVQLLLRESRAYLTLQAPRILQAHLQEGLVIQSETLPARIGDPSHFILHVSMTNRLSLETDQSLTIALPDWISSPHLQAHSPEISLSYRDPSPVLLIQPVETDSFAAQLSFSRVVTHFVEDRTTTVYATETEAMNQRFIRFDADKAVPVLLEVSLDFPVDFSIETSLPYRVEDRSPYSLRFIVNASEGRHEVRVAYRWAEPFRIEWSIPELDAESTLLRVSITNRFAPISDASISLTPPFPCESEHLSILPFSPDLISSIQSLGSSHWISLHSSHWNQKETKQAQISLRCPSALHEWTDSQLSEIERMMQSYPSVNPEWERELIRARESMQNGDLIAAYSQMETVRAHLYSAPSPAIIPVWSPTPSPDPLPSPSPSVLRAEPSSIHTLRERISLKLSQFEDVFFTPPEWRSQVTRLPSYRNASFSANELESILHTLDSRIFSESDEIAPISREWLSAQESQANPHILSLEESIRAIQAQAEQALSMARQRLYSTSDEEALTLLNQAGTWSARGAYASAYVMATEINGRTIPASDDPKSLLYIIPLILAASGLFFYLWKRNASSFSEDVIE